MTSDTSGWPDDMLRRVDPWLQFLAFRAMDQKEAAANPRNPTSPGEREVSRAPTDTISEATPLPIITEIDGAAGVPAVEGLEIEPLYRNGGSRIVTGFLHNPASGGLLAVLKKVPQLKSARPLQRHLHDSLPAVRAVQTPGDRDLISRFGDGRGVVVGFIDNGCAFAHPHFLVREGDRVGSRVRRIWFQSDKVFKDGRPTGREAGLRAMRDGGWFTYGYEMRDTDIDAAIAAHCGSERYVYEAIGLRMEEFVRSRRVERFTHGTHVMDIAAGNGPSPGVAPGSDIVFVQLPPYAILENTDQASAKHLLDGVAYVFAYARQKGLPAVVNISYGAFTGPHDGSSLLERGLDELLSEPDRAVVISAGNGFEAQCHAEGVLEAGATRSLGWIVSPLDPTPNFMEIWFEGGQDVAIAVEAPDGTRVLELPGPGRCKHPDSSRPVCRAFMVEDASKPGRRHAVIALNAPVRDLGRNESEPAPSGTWRIHLAAKRRTSFKAWIERDDRDQMPAADQSRFVWSDACRENTVSGICTGRDTIVVGAFNTATNRVMRYSAIGTGCEARKLPDIYAPGASDPGGHGILAAASGSANPVRLTGTSMAAPFVTGLVARMLGYAATKGRSLSSAEIRGLLRGQGAALGLPLADAGPGCGSDGEDPRKGARAIDVGATMRALEAKLAKPG